MTLPFPIPAGLAAQAALGPRWVDWLERLPGLMSGLVDEWELEYDGAPWHGFTSIVVPVTRPISTGTGPISTGTGPISTGRAVLKVTFDGDDESLHEGLALQHWQGDGTVAMLRADPRRRALLLERLHQMDLRSLDALGACEVVAGFYARIHIAAPPQLRPLTSYVNTWNQQLRALGDDVALPRRLVERTLSLADDFVADPASTGTMIHGDLHYENVLAADREPWLVIDPKPMSGDPHYEVAPLLWNRWDEVAGAGKVREGVRRRFHTVVDRAELDEDRARDWVIVRAIHDASWTLTDAADLGRSLDAEDREWITRMVAVAKAML